VPGRHPGGWGRTRLCEARLMRRDRKADAPLPLLLPAACASTRKPLHAVQNANLSGQLFALHEAVGRTAARAFPSCAGCAATSGDAQAGPRYAHPECCPRSCGCQAYGNAVKVLPRGSLGPGSRSPTGARLRGNLGGALQPLRTLPLDSGNRQWGRGRPGSKRPAPATTTRGAKSGVDPNVRGRGRHAPPVGAQSHH
jgi:hypothetical protein